METKKILTKSMPIIIIIAFIFFLSVYIYPEISERLGTFSPLGAPLPSTDFEGSDFRCLKISYGYECGIDFINNLDEDVKVVFFFSDDKGRIVERVVDYAQGSSGRVVGSLRCESGSYRVSWKAFRASDTTYSDPLAESTSIVSFICE